MKSFGPDVDGRTNLGPPRMEGRSGELTRAGISGNLFSPRKRRASWRERSIDINNGCNEGADGPTMTLPPPGSMEPANTASIPRRVLHVLVVDDHKDTADSLCVLLRYWCIQVHVSYNSREALAAILRHRPDAALVDIMLPGMDGYELARQIRSNGDLTDVMLVAVTGLGDENHRRLAREAGFARFLLKPRIYEDLREILTALEQKEKT
jgi:CheY-like chemotaxis protein